MKDTLLVTPYYDPNIVGGAEISTQLIAEGIRGRCDVLTFGRVNSKRELNGVNVYEINFPEFTSLWGQPLDGTTLTVNNKLDGHLHALFPSHSHVNRYCEFIKEHGYRTVIMNTNETVMDRPSLWKAAYKSGARVVLTLRDNMLLEKKIGRFNYGMVFRRIVRQQLKWIDEFVAPSQYMIDLYAQYGMSKLSSQVIPNAVNMLPSKAVPFGLKSGVIYAGSISKQKGIPTLVKAFRLLTGNISLKLIGRGPLANKYRDMVGVTMLDWMSREELYAVMANAKVLVLPSEWPEAFGRVLVEAVFCGTLVVGSDAGGIPEVLGHDERYIFPRGGANELAARISRILELSEAEYMRELSELQRKFERFSVRRYIASWSEVIGGEVPEHA
jgi:glycosyltransferase involved in cell wall biosynthesis